MLPSILLGHNGFTSLRVKGLVYVSYLRGPTIKEAIKGRER